MERRCRVWGAMVPASAERMARPVCKRFYESGLISLRQRIRSQGMTLAKMEIRASRSS